MDTLYDEIFLDAFISQDDERLNKEDYSQVVKEKLVGDDQLCDRLIEQFDKIEHDGDGKVNES